jgi:hypothetical protein
MANGEFLTIESGRKTKKTAINVSTGVSDANKILRTDSSGRIDNSFLPVGVGADTLTIEASENLDSGDFVSLFDDAGTGKCRKADSSNDRPAVGFVLSAVTSGNNATVYFEGTNTALSGMTPGARQYLSTAGDVTETPVTGTGTIHQFLGVARSATELPFEGSESVVNE